MTKNEAKEILKLVELIEEQQRLVKLLLESYQPKDLLLKEAMLSRNASIRQKIEKYKNRLIAYLAQDLDIMDFGKRIET